MQSPVLDRDTGRRADRVEELGSSDSAGSCTSAATCSTVSVDDRRRSAAARLDGSTIGLPVQIGPAPNCGSQYARVNDGIAESPCESVAKVIRRGFRPELDKQVCDRQTRETRAKDATEDDEWDRDMGPKDEPTDRLEVDLELVENDEDGPQEDSDGADEYRDEGTSERWAREEPAPRQGEGQDDGRDRNERTLCRVDVARDAGVRPDHERVWAPARLEKQQPGQLQRKGHDREQPDDEEIEPRLQPTVREGEEEAHEDDDPRVGEPDPRCEQRG